MSPSAFGARGSTTAWCSATGPHGVSNAVVNTKKKHCFVPSTNPQKCCNCGGSHPANWRGCEAHQIALGLQKHCQAPKQKPAAPVQVPRQKPRAPAQKQVADPRKETPRQPPQQAEQGEPAQPGVSYASVARGGSKPQPKPRKKSMKKGKKGKTAQREQTVAQPKVPQAMETSEPFEKATPTPQPNAESASRPPTPSPRRCGLVWATHPQSRTSATPNSKSPPPGFISHAAVLRWTAPIVPIILGQDLPANELLVAILPQPLPTGQDA